MAGRELKSFTSDPGVDREAIRRDEERRARGGDAVIQQHLFAVSVVVNDPGVDGDPVAFVRRILESNGCSVEHLGRYTK